MVEIIEMKDVSTHFYKTFISLIQHSFFKFFTTYESHDVVSALFYGPFYFYFPHPKHSFTYNSPICDLTSHESHDKRTIKTKEASTVYANTRPTAAMSTNQDYCQSQSSPHRLFHARYQPLRPGQGPPVSAPTRPPC